VRSLPDRVLQAKSYRRLLVLLGDRAAAKLLHHATDIDDTTIKMTDDIPPPLRSLVFSMQPWFRGVECLADGLRFLVRSGAAEAEQFRPLAGRDRWHRIIEASAQRLFAGVAGVETGKQFTGAW
jgi:hypothetical protein